jgi:hypothetical protein
VGGDDGMKKITPKELERLWKSIDMKQFWIKVIQRMMEEKK